MNQCNAPKKLDTFWGQSTKSCLLFYYLVSTPTGPPGSLSFFSLSNAVTR